MNCPKCGYERQNRDDAFVPPGECPACGVVYAKHDSTEAVQSTPSPHLKPSPVDAISLRKARERVEKRLREQLGNRIQDDRHARTLELAKQLASEEIRKRQDEWKQAHAEEGDARTDAEAPAAADPEEESQALVAESEPTPGDDPSPDQTQCADITADEIMITAAAATQETVASPEPAVDHPPEPANDGESVAARDSREDPESAPDGEVETAPTDTLEVAVEEEAPLDAVWPPTDPETAVPESPEDLPAAHVAAAASPRAPESGSGVGLIRLLPVVAWLILGAGVIGAVLSWTTIGDVQAGVRPLVGEGPHGLPLGLLLGFAYLATGVLGFAFFWVSSLISTQLRDIHHLLMPEDRDENTLQDEAA